jgi:predicted metal-binding protein
MTRIAVVSCKRIQDRLCVACAKCLKAVKKKEGEFSRYSEDIDLVALGNCGDCPGLIIPKLKLMKEVADGLDREFDVIHLGTCIVSAIQTGKCPLDLDLLPSLVREKFGKELVLGTHPY